MFHGVESLLLLQVHDELIFDVAANQQRITSLIEIIRQCMEVDVVESFAFEVPLAVSAILFILNICRHFSFSFQLLPHSSNGMPKRLNCLSVICTYVRVCAKCCHIFR
jgi:hypothetical protein